MTRYSIFTLSTFLLAFVVILLGAYTRLTNAGLSCPDWPNCYGYLTAPHTLSQLQDAAARFPNLPVDMKKAWTEMTHRYFAGTEGLLIMILALALFRAKPLQRIRARKSIATLLLSMLLVQIMLGMLTVTAKLKPVIVLAHLLTGLSILSVLWWTFLSFINLRRAPIHSANKQIPWLWIGLAIVALQITLGGWVTTHYAGLACVDFPYCNGALLPTLHWRLFDSDLITIHMLHRIGAMITASYLAILAYRLWSSPSFHANAQLIIALVALQLTLGILNIVWLLPVWVALIHHAVAITIVLTLIATLVKAYRPTQDIYHVTRYA